MLGLVTWDEFWNVINLAKDASGDWFLQGPTRRFIDTYNARPGFFIPYKNKHEFAGGLLATVIYPTTLSLCAGLSTICAVFATVIGIGSLLAAIGTAIFGNYELCDESIEDAATGFHIVGLALVATAVSGFLVAASLIHAPLSFLTRTGASIVSVVDDCVSKSQATQTMLIL